MTPTPEHAYLSASAAHRWMACPGSPEAEAASPDVASPYAQEGTVAHELAALALTDPMAYAVAMGRGSPLPVSGVVPDEEMREAVSGYVEYIGKLRGRKFVEQRVDLSEWVSGGFGTADAIVLHRRTLHVIDLKYGRGVRVDASNNPQLLLYALGAMALVADFVDVRQVVLTIYQPRLDHVSTVTMRAAALRRWGEERRRKQRLKVVWDRGREMERLQREVDDLLDKINRSGLDSLSRQEVSRLKEASRKLKEWEELR